MASVGMKPLQIDTPECRRTFCRVADLERYLASIAADELDGRRRLRETRVLLGHVLARAVPWLRREGAEGVYARVRLHPRVARRCIRMAEHVAGPDGTIDEGRVVHAQLAYRGRCQAEGREPSARLLRPVGSLSLADLEVLTGARRSGAVGRAGGMGGMGGVGGVGEHPENRTTWSALGKGNPQESDHMVRPDSADRSEPERAARARAHGDAVGPAVGGPAGLGGASGNQMELPFAAAVERARGALDVVLALAERGELTGARRARAERALLELMEVAL